MNKKSFVLLSAGLLAVSACAVEAQQNYTLSAPAPADKNNTMAYLLDWDSSQKLDSVIVTDGQIKFAGNVDGATLGRLVIDGARGPIFVLEQGDIVLSPEGKPSGTPLNVKFISYTDRMGQIQQEYQTLDMNDSIQAAKAGALEAEFNAIPQKAYEENLDNPIGLYWFLQRAYEMDLATLDAEIAKNPSLSKSKRVESVRNALLAKAETSVGKQYKDFTITYDGKTEKLSDYVGKGHYTLVDFWASWCGPCIRQTKVIKELYNKYKGKGLEVVGVAVWDEPANTLKAIKSHGLEWPCIMNAQTIPTDLYGISGIPCIILIDPDGKIVSRDKQSQELIDDVDAAMANFHPETSAVATEAAADTAMTDANVIF